MRVLVGIKRWGLRNVLIDASGGALWDLVALLSNKCCLLVESGFLCQPSTDGWVTKDKTRAFSLQTNLVMNGIQKFFGRQ
jgi:hypothetical protein